MSIADTLGSDCRDYKSAQMTESWKSEEGESKSTQSLVMQVSKEHHPMGMTIQGHTGVSETDKIIAMNTCGTSRSKT